MPACASYAAATGRLRLPGGLVSVPNRPWREVSTVSSAMGHQVRLWSSDVAGRLSRAIGVRTANVVGRLGSVLIVMLTLVGGPRPIVAAPQSEASSHGVKRDERLNFNIPSQPLTDALYAYTSISGVEALAPGELLANLRSAQIRGTFTAKARSIAALQSCSEARTACLR